MAVFLAAQKSGDPHAAQNCLSAFSDAAPVGTAIAFAVATAAIPGITTPDDCTQHADGGDSGGDRSNGALPTIDFHTGLTPISEPIAPTAAIANEHHLLKTAFEQFQSVARAA
jgi:hypothetical protein